MEASWMNCMILCLDQNNFTGPAAAVNLDDYKKQMMQLLADGG